MTDEEEAHMMDLIIWKVNATKVLLDCKPLLEKYMHETAKNRPNDLQDMDSIMQTLTAIDEILK
jgi:hypothetical protein